MTPAAVEARLVYPVEANEVFAELPEAMIDALEGALVDRLEQVDLQARAVPPDGLARAEKQLLGAPLRHHALRGRAGPGDRACASMG